MNSSHRNRHSENRPYLCEAEGCGKGFKRKNELKRHGLSHDSPGYVCPFCADRDHRYPRPDNLQRYAIGTIFRPRIVCVDASLGGGMVSD